MKLDLLEPNAHYDLAHGEPSAIEYDNDGSVLFRYNIKPEYGIPEGQEEEVQIGWQCREIRIWSTPTKAHLKKEIIRSVVDETQEFALVNGYNQSVLGIKEDAQAVADYKEYLVFTNDVDAMLLKVLPTE